VKRVWVFHRGALGDSVLLWPRLRAMVQRGDLVWLVADGSKARLAAAELRGGLIGVDAEHPRFRALWRTDGPVERVEGVDEVIDHLGGRTTAERLAEMFPGATVRSEAPPRGGLEAVRWLAVHPAGKAGLRDTAQGPVVIHAGAGGEAKRWPMERWRALADAISTERSTGVVALAGEAEREKFTDRDAAAFAQMGGRYVFELETLADQIRRASLFIGCDTGPTHLAAQLGVPTLALFGPTDPGAWAPVGPAVRVLAPPEPRGMAWLGVAEVLAAVQALRPMK
jgi:hypothetical protein